MRSLIMVIIALACVFYLSNIGFGLIEIIPDGIPFFGNIDEAGATILLLNCLRYFGIDLASLFSKTKAKLSNDS